MINLTQKSLLLLKKCLKAHKPHLLYALEKESEFNEEFYNELRDAVCDELMINGFEEDRPTKYGLELESLIDEIGRLFI